MHRYIKQTGIFLCLFMLTLAIFFFVPTNVFAQGGDPIGLQYGAATGLSGDDIRVTAARIIRVALQLLGIVTVAIMIYGGFLWMTAAGNEDQIGKAKKTLIAAIIGLAIILSSWAITNFVIANLSQATQGGAVYQF